MVAFLDSRRRLPPGAREFEWPDLIDGATFLRSLFDFVGFTVFPSQLCGTTDLLEAAVGLPLGPSLFLRVSIFFWPPPTGNSFGSLFT